MKHYIQIATYAAIIFFACFYPVYGASMLFGDTLNTMDAWKTDTTAGTSTITQRVANRKIKITGLTTGQCLTLDGNNVLTTSACAGSLTIGDFIYGSTPNAMLYVDPTSHLANAADLHWNNTDKILGVQPNTDLYYNDIPIIEFGTDSTCSYGCNPFGFYWSNNNTGNGRVELRDRYYAQGVDFYAGSVTADSYNGTSYMTNYGYNYGYNYSPDGSAASPTHSFANDTSTGMYRAGVNKIGFTTGGTGRVFIDGSGNVGIGTSSPTKLLEIKGNQAGGIMTINRTPTGAANSVYGTQTIKATHDGDMGDGFGVAQQFSIQDNANVENAIANIRAYRTGADNSGSLDFVTAESGVLSVQMTIAPNGRVGIGSTTPSRALSFSKASGGLLDGVQTTSLESFCIVCFGSFEGNNGDFYFKGNNATAASEIFVVDTTSGATNPAILNIKKNGTSLFQVTANTTMALGTTTRDSVVTIQSASSTIPVLTIASTTGVSMLKLNQSGNLWVNNGNTQPNTTTYGSRAIKGDFVSDSGQNGYIRVLGGAGGTKAGIIVGNNDGSGTNYGEWIFDNATNEFYIRQTYGSSGGFGLGAGNRKDDLIIQSTTAYVGIGSTTPSAKLTVSGTSSSPTADLFVVSSSTRAHILTVSSNGAVGINKSNPLSTLKLDVNGRIGNSTNRPGSYLDFTSSGYLTFTSNASDANIGVVNSGTSEYALMGVRSGQGAFFQHNGNTLRIEGFGGGLSQVNAGVLATGDYGLEQAMIDGNGYFGGLGLFAISDLVSGTPGTLYIGDNTSFSQLFWSIADTGDAGFQSINVGAGNLIGGLSGADMTISANAGIDFRGSAGVAHFGSTIPIAMHGGGLYLGDTGGNSGGTLYGEKGQIRQMKSITIGASSTPIALLTVQATSSYSNTTLIPLEVASSTGESMFRVALNGTVYAGTTTTALTDAVFIGQKKSGTTSRISAYSPNGTYRTDLSIDNSANSVIGPFSYNLIGENWQLGGGSPNTGTLRGLINLTGSAPYSNAARNILQVYETKTNTSGTQAIVYINPTYNQVAATSSNTDLLINRIQTSVGSGAQYLIDAQVGGTSRFRVDNTGVGYFLGNVGFGTTTPTQKLHVDGGIRLDTATSKPTCDSSTRGTFWFTKSGAGVKDAAEVCAKDAADAYAWRTIY